MFKNYCKDFLQNKSGSSKTAFMVGDLNINSFDYDNNALLKDFQSDFSKCFLSLTQRTTRVTRTTATTTDRIVTDAILESTLHSGIIKTNISDNFPIFAILEHVYMIPKVNSNRFEISNLFEMSFRLHDNLHGGFTAATFQTIARLYCTCENYIF